MVIIGSDHAGYSLKEEIKGYLESIGEKYIDEGTYSTESCDYPLIALKVAEKMQKVKCNRAILICGSGIGISIAANKISGIRASLCSSAELAEMARKHNNANVLCLAGRYIDSHEAQKTVSKFLTTDFEGGRHQRRISEIKDIENKRIKINLEEGAMEQNKNVLIMDHPLIQDKISLLRNKNTSSKEFRELVSEVTMLMCYESLRDLKLKEIEIETPIATAKTKVLEERHIAFIPILRAGLGMVDGAVNLVPTAKVGHIGLYRDPETRKPVEYYCKLPVDVSKRDVIVLDPMLATGGTVTDALTLVKKHHPNSIKFMCLLASDRGIETLTKAHPDVKIYCAAKDPILNSDDYIVPGLGDAGDRIFGTK